MFRIKSMSIDKAAERPKLDIITIDPKGAKDLDDGFAVVGEDPNNFTLNICIADVSTHVKINSPLDREAYRKGFSRYNEHGAVDPMFPRDLSEGLLSLLPNQDRLTLTASFNILKDSISPPVFSLTQSKSIRQFTYEEADQVLNGKNIDNPDKIDFRPRFSKFRKAAEILIDERKKRGSKVYYNICDYTDYADEDGNIVQIPANKKSFSHILVSEFMVATNLAVAEFIIKNLPFGFFRVTGQQQNTKQNIAARSAHYSPDPKPHNNFKGVYAHGTSPIRRYADLITHRIVIAILKKEKQTYTKQILKNAARHLNAIEDTLSINEYLHC